MSDIVKKGFFRRCLYRATGAYLLEQHIQMLEQQLEQGIKEKGKWRRASCPYRSAPTIWKVHSDAQDAHRNAIDARLRQTDASADQTRIRLEKAEEALREAGLLASELHLFNKKSYSQAGEDAILMYIFVMLGVPLSQCTYLDLGANHPCDMSNTWFFYQQGARGILVDANPKLAEELRQARPEDRVINACVGPVSGKHWIPCAEC
ncbi:MAG: hypothetical protein ACLT3Y_10060 [Ruminococcus callidus]